MGEWLQSLIPWGTDVILWAQSFSSPFLDALFVGATLLGEEYFYLAFLPLVYWCLNKQLGISLSYVTMLSNYINGWAKLLYRIPRPADPRITQLRVEVSPSFPSGHAQNATTIWGYLALRVRKTWFWIAMIGLITLIAVSRIYVGVHFPQDVVGGVCIGIIFLVLYAWLGDRISAPWLRRQSLVPRLALGIIAPLILLFIYPRDHLGLYPAETAATVAGTLIGMSIGFPLEERYVRFSVAGQWWKRVLRFLVGIILVGLVYAGPKLLLPETMDVGPETLIRVIRYALVAFVLAFAAPWLFIQIKLAETA